MSYKIEIDFSPAYELVNSLNAYLSKKEQKSIELGKKWVNEVNSTITPTLKKKLSEVAFDFTGGLEILIYHCPGKRSIPEFLQWLNTLTAEDIILLLIPYSTDLPPDLPTLKETWVDLLSEWNQQYFEQLDPTIIIGLERDAEDKKVLNQELAPEQLFEEATNGMRQLSDSTIKTIRLIPQYHFSPINRSIYYDTSEMFICFYACDALPPKEGEPPLSLMRLTRCLADETRMKLLHYMSIKERTFAELVEMSGLAKSTVHHHLIALRGAGLIRIVTRGRHNIYQFREESIDKMGSSLRSYFQIREDKNEK